MIRDFESITVGDSAEGTVQVTQSLIDSFIESSGDRNPIHHDAVYASTTPFGGIIAPGMLVASFISAAIANQLPGPGTIYLQQSLTFLSPVHVDSLVMVRVTVTEKIRERSRLRLDTLVLAEDGRHLIEGNALVKVLGGP